MSSTLLSLPVEIRGYILEQLLLGAPNPYCNLDSGYEDEAVIVWYTTYDDGLKNPEIHGRECMSPTDTRDSRITAFYSLALCNKTISYEASFIFYGRLMFVFSGVFTFRSVNFWLKSIGPRNRGYLANLAMVDAALFPCEDDEDFPGLPPDLTIVERFFQLLDNTCPGQGSRNMTLNIYLEDYQTPEILGLESDNPCYTSFPMERLELMERFRALHATTRVIEVVYKGCALRKYLKPEQLRDIGWELSVHDTIEMTDYTLQFQPR